ncbi:MAG: stimulus-sensing domain-containing protein [Pseudomonadota bacterium]|nr:stimulus-sensing domain-containing protein [Pseudomonadota bacterium]
MTDISSQKKEKLRGSIIANRTNLRWFSPLTRRILAINILALGFLSGGLLFLGEYRQKLIEAEIDSLSVQAQMFAAALGEGAIDVAGLSDQRLISEIADRIVRRLVKTTGARARLFKNDGTLAADSQRLIGPAGMVRIEELLPPGEPDSIIPILLDFFDRLMRQLIREEVLSSYKEKIEQKAHDYPEVLKALSGDRSSMIRSAGSDNLILSIAVPIQRYKQVLGALMLTKGSKDIDKSLLEVRIAILKIFAAALAITVLLSIYLSGTIARPIRLLADAAIRVRHDRGRQENIPDFAGRNDEIGDLAVSLSEMTNALHLRIGAIESFAADVAHEIKNPLTSIRSAVETTARLKDPKQQRKLLVIILEDVIRLDRLISEISDASRLDAELSRELAEPVEIGAMLKTIAKIQQNTDELSLPDSPKIFLNLSDNPNEILIINGLEIRLAQVFQNLISNSISFSPPGGPIYISAYRRKDKIIITIDDNGPGLPPGKETTIFERFYTQRRSTEDSSNHSGLGLSISLQIIHAHNGSLTAKNRISTTGNIQGARFTVCLPAS